MKVCIIPFYNSRSETDFPDTRINGNNVFLISDIEVIPDACAFRAFKLFFGFFDYFGNAVTIPLGICVLFFYRIQQREIVETLVAEQSRRKIRRFVIKIPLFHFRNFNFEVLNIQRFQLIRVFIVKIPVFTVKLKRRYCIVA